MTTQRGYRNQNIALLPGDTLRVKQDSWVEVTSFGATEPEYVLAQDGREATIAQAKAEYVHDRIDLDELEQRIEAALRGKLTAPPKPIDSKLAVLPRGVEYHPLPNPGQR